jgi:hypothetical protein
LSSEESIMLFRAMALAALATLLVACGGGGGSSGASTSNGPIQTGTPTVSVTTPTVVATPASIDVLAGANTLGSGGGNVQITALVKDAGNVGMANQTVTFSADSGNLSVASPRTDASGVVSAVLSVGSNKANRNITVRVVGNGGVSGTLVIPVTGTQLQITGPGTLKAGAGAQQYSIKLLDSSGAGVAGRTVTIASQLGNSLSGTGLTDPSGVASFIYTPNTPGSDVLTATSQGSNASLALQISNIDFEVVSPAASTQIPVSTSSPIRVRYRVGPTGQPGRSVLFSTTRGTLSSATTITDGFGEATVSISSSSAGPASVVAEINGIGQVVLPIQFVAVTPAVISLQANPGALSPNASGSSANQVALEAVVRDATGNPVSGRQVNFNIVADSSSGALTQPSALTDFNGRASVQYVAGASSTASNGVIVQAGVASTSIQSTAALTVSGQALFVSIGFGNVITNADPQTYSKQFNIYVTDANGTAIPNKTVNLRAIPLTFAKGTLRFNTATTPAQWTPASFTECPSEDRDLDGALDPGEDLDGSGGLSPGNVASFPASLGGGTVVTGSNGQATFSLVYGENYVPWVTFRLEARTTVGGTESIRSIAYELEGLASDFTDGAVSPAGQISPFGRANSCTNPN